MHPTLIQTFSNYKTIIFVGGGSGGHIQPIISLVTFLREDMKLSSMEILWIGGKDSTEQEAAEENNISFENISTLKLSSTRSPKIFLYPFFLLRGIAQARKTLIAIRKRMKDSSYNKKSLPSLAIFSKGGPGSVAIGIAAWALRIPLYIHESDTIPGRSNKLLAKFAKKIFVGFESTKKYFNPKKCDYIGQILHPVFEKGRVTSDEGRVSWKTSKKHILVICGSQGARAIFEAILENFSSDTQYEWIIALGKLNSGMKRDFVSQADTQAVEWIEQENIANLLQNTDIAITRGSATTLAEIDVFGVKKIIIPLPYSADNHQYWNAKEYSEKGDILLEQKNLEQLRATIEQLGPNSKHSNTSQETSSI